MTESKEITSMSDAKNVEHTCIENTLVLPKKNRTHTIDILRGSALLGVVIVNFYIFYRYPFVQRHVSTVNNNHYC